VARAGLQFVGQLRSAPGPVLVGVARDLGRQGLQEDGELVIGHSMALVEEDADGGWGRAGEMLTRAKLGVPLRAS
jgi:hypothetical protein